MMVRPFSGRRVVGGQWRRRPTVGLLTQDTAFERPDRTVRATYELPLGPARAEKVPLSSLGLIDEADLDKPVGHLSVGRRLALALLVTRPPQLLLSTSPPTTSPPPCATNWRPPGAPAPARSSWRAPTAGCAGGGRAAKSVWNRTAADGRTRCRTIPTAL